MGGGVMRTAAKAAVLAGYRSNPARKAPYLTPGAHAASSHGVHVASEAEFSSLSTEMGGVPSAAAVHHPAVLAIDDWDFVGGNEEEVIGVVDPPPRMVFGPVPTWEEAKEATSDLKEAMEKVYFSTPGGEESVKVSLVSDHEGGHGSDAILPVPKNIVQAFSLLQGSADTQDIVASLASDKNVWEAVMNNHKVIEFRNKYQPIAPIEKNFAPEESIGENEISESFSETVESADKETSESTFFSDLVQNVKVKVNEMVSNISDFFQDFMATAPDSSGQTQTTKPDTSGSNNFTEYFGAFMALAVAAMMVVLVKRG